MKKVFLDSSLEDRTNKLSDGLTKIKPMYIPCINEQEALSSIQEVISEYKDSVLLVKVEGDNIKELFYLFDTKAGIMSMTVIESEYEAFLYSVVVSDISVSNKSWIPIKLGLFIEDILEIKKLPYNVYIGSQFESYMEVGIKQAVNKLSLADRIKKLREGK